MARLFYSAITIVLPQMIILEVSLEIRHSNCPVACRKTDVSVLFRTPMSLDKMSVKV